MRDLEPDLRRRIRQEKAVPVMDRLHAWMIAQRDLVPEGSAISRALDYSLKRWAALSRYLDDGAVPIDNNWCENQIRPWALGRKNWLFAGLTSHSKIQAGAPCTHSSSITAHENHSPSGRDWQRAHVRGFVIAVRAKAQRAKTVKTGAYMSVIGSV
ncbi:hypothetical protein ALP85_200007 [Pseudomonas syringae pv. syringae]|nr:hypothetical protein ALP85_200007 [Pseudomonas syringae pv. syringae]